MTATTTCPYCQHTRPEHDQHCPVQQLAEEPSPASVTDDYNHQWENILDPRRRAALEHIWKQFNDAVGYEVSLSDELIAERRIEAAE